MPAQNADLSLRQSITGANQPLVSSPTDLYAPISSDDADDQDEPRGPIPPILVVPPGVMLADFCKQVESFYELDDITTKFNGKHENEDELVEHSIDLMDEGMAFSIAGSYRAASDIFSLCVLLYPNYLYRFLLATVRYNFSDYPGALRLMEAAVAQIRDGQKLDTELVEFSESIDFTERFYTLYALTLFFNGRVDEAKNIVNFVLDKKILKIPPSYFDLLSVFQIINDKNMLAKLSKSVLPIIEKEEDENVRNQALENLKLLLQTSN